MLSFSHHSLIQVSRVWLLAPLVKRTCHHQTQRQFNDLSLKTYLHLGAHSALGPQSAAKSCICSSPLCTQPTPSLTSPSLSHLLDLLSLDCKQLEEREHVLLIIIICTMCGKEF